MKIKINKSLIISTCLKVLLSGNLFVFWAFPASTTYQLKNFSFGSGGGNDLGSTNYKSEVLTGEQAAANLSGSTYELLPGLIATQLANVPSVVSFENQSNNYNKLQLIVNTAGNPSDTLYAIAISDDAFTTTNYVQSDATVAETLGSEDWQTYTSWGGATGTTIIGLTPDTTYTVKLKAKQGSFTEGSWGPTAQASTDPLSISFDLDTASSDQETSAPYQINFSDLTSNTVNDSTEQLWVDFSTNANYGGAVYIYGSQAGLYSSATDYLISAVSGNLAALSEGFGLQGVSASQSSGGPFSLTTAFDLSDDNVAEITTSPQELFAASAPVTAGRGSILSKAKVTDLTPAANDYSNIFTVVAVGSF